MSTHIGWPQALWLTIASLGICFHAGFHGSPRKDHWNLGSKLFGTACQVALLWSGGFFG